MIPVKLSLKNFLCYRDQVPSLSFEGIHIACLCGDNGNGKSALFDAITWALWGKARAKSDDDLIHIGQSEMEVELEFDSSGQRYRIVRKRTKKSSSSRAGQSILELQIADGDVFKTISGNTMNETQEKIINLIKLDYETFVNSAFIRQGHADEFSVKTPAKRKEVIANILGLSMYDNFEKKAKDAAANLEIEAKANTNAIEEYIRQLSNKGEFEAEFARLTDSVNKLEKQRTEQESKLTDLRKRKEQLELKKEQLVHLQTRKDEIDTELAQWQKKIANYKDDIEKYERILVQKAEILAGYADYSDLKVSNDDYNNKLRILMGIREQKVKLEKRISEQNQKLTIEFEKIQDRIKQKEEKAAGITKIETKLNQANADLKLIVQQEATINEMRKKLEQILSERSYLLSSLSQLDNEEKNINEKIAMLGGEDARCPLCETELGVDGRHKIKEKYILEISDKLKIRKELNNQIAKKIAEQKEIEENINHNESQLARERINKLNTVSVLEKELADAQIARREIDEDSNKLKEVEQLLSSRQYAISEQHAFNELDKEERNLGYDGIHHEKVKLQLQEKQKYEKMKQELDITEQNINKDKKSAAEAIRISEQLGKTLVQIGENAAVINSEIRGMEAINGELTGVEAQFKLLLEQERENRDTLAQVQERLRNYNELEKVKAEKEAQQIRYQHEEAVFKELAEAFSKKGVQALLIQQAFPEIEQEANKLLGRMTDNRLSLTLESQKEAKTKKSDPIETLDIKIADELGTRDYEMFSGGEAFRIDLALRIALSKLLVRRAGASLPILIIDEGFGTQDHSGREKLVETINSIQDDFDKIFVITHLEDLKDYFPVQLRVSKTAYGSTITIE